MLQVFHLDVCTSPNGLIAILDRLVIIKKNENKIKYIFLEYCGCVGFFTLRVVVLVSIIIFSLAERLSSRDFT